MGTPFRSDEECRAAVDLVKLHGSVSEASRQTGEPRSTLQEKIMDARRRWPDCLPDARNGPDWVRRAALRGEIAGPPIPEIGQPPLGFVVRRNSGEYDADGNLRRQWVETGQGNDNGYKIPAGHVVKGESALLDAGGNVLAKWIKTREGAGEGLVEALKAAFAEYDGKAPPIEAPATVDSDLLTVYPVADLHYGMYAWGAETAADYDTDIATQVATGGIRSLVAQSYPSERAVVLVLGDYFHQNDQKNATPGSGHRLDVDGRWASVYHKGALLLLEIVKLVAAKHKLVTLKVLPGNHDEDAAVTLVVAMSLFFSQEKRITVEMDPKSAWYHRFGLVLIGAHHGHKIRTFQAMAMTMVVDRAQDYGQTLFRHYYSGHIHHKESEEHMGILVESLQSPAAPDAYNYSSGYRSGRSFCAVTFHKSRGRIGCNWVEIVGDNKIAA